MKRKLFDELVAGVESMRQVREGKITLRTHEVDDLPPLEIDTDMIRETRGHEKRVHPTFFVFNFNL